MIQVVYVGGQRYRLQASDVIGEGGEAVVYRHPPDQALKVYMEFDDPAYAEEPQTHPDIRRRREDHQRKLPAFPKGLPSHVVQPTALAYDQPCGRVMGYTMPFLPQLEELVSYSDRKFREQSGIDANLAVRIFRNLHDLVSGIHAQSVVIGDFNDLNVLVSASGEVYAVDADSMQYGGFLCRTFTTRFVDPLNCAADKLMLVNPHTTDSDWYAFATMLFQCLLFINPYHGVHKPKGGTRLRDAARVLNRVTVFSSDVIVPKAAIPHTALPDELLQYFADLYERDQRGIFPLNLLEGLRWTACTSCGIMHARQTCPACAAPGKVTQKVTIRGNVTATRLFRTDGLILFAAVQGDELRYVYHESGAYKREGNVTVLNAGLDRDLRIRIWGGKTVLGQGNTLVALDAQGNRTRFETQTVGRLPVFDANVHHLYWLQSGRLVRDTPPLMHGDLPGTVRIGDALSNRTLVWAGDRFGFGFYRAGSLMRGLVFDASRSGVTDVTDLPPMRGNLIDATCAFASHRVWFMTSVQEGADIRNRCFVIDDTGQILAQAEAVQGDGTWLGEDIRGHLARGEQLFVATDGGIVRIGIDGNGLHVTREYPDTEPFVDSNTQLLPDREGVLAVSRNEIYRLQIRQSDQGATA